MPRIARIVAEGYPHHITQRGNNKQDVFFDDQDKRFYLELLKKYSKEGETIVHAYCLMDNHVHLLVTPNREDSLAKTMQKLSLRFTQHVNKKYKRTGRLWECRFYSSVVDREGYLWSVCRYIERNPVRAKIVNKSSRYEWSSASIAYRIDMLEPIWDEAQRQGYLTYLNTFENEDEVCFIRKHTYSGRPIGPPNFISHIASILNIDLSTRPKGRPRRV